MRKLKNLVMFRLLISELNNWKINMKPGVKKKGFNTRDTDAWTTNPSV